MDFLPVQHYFRFISRSLSCTSTSARNSNDDFKVSGAIRHVILCWIPSMCTTVAPILRQKLSEQTLVLSQFLLALTKTSPHDGISPPYALRARWCGVLLTARRVLLLMPVSMVRMREIMVYEKTVSCVATDYQLPR